MIQAGWNQTIGSLAILGRLAGLSKNVANISETVEAANKPKLQPYQKPEIDINPEPTPEDLSGLYARANSYGEHRQGEFWTQGINPMMHDMEDRLQTQYGLDQRNARGLMAQVRRGEFSRSRGGPTFSEAMQARLQAMRAAEAENVRPTNEMPNGGPNNG